MNLQHTFLDLECFQSREVWTGTTYAIAAAMYQLGLKKEAFATVKGIFEMTYHELGYWFQTPEAWDDVGRFRSLSYMRPLSIWAIHWGIERMKE